VSQLSPLRIEFVKKQEPKRVSGSPRKDDLSFRDFFGKDWKALEPLIIIGRQLNCMRNYVGEE